MDQQQPLSIGQVLDRGFGLYRRALGKLLPFCLALVVMGILPRLLHPASAAMQGGRLGGGYFITVALVTLVNLLFQIAILRKLDDVDSGRNQMGTAEALTGGLPYFLPALGATLLYALIIMVGFILLVVPGVIFSISLIMVFFAVVLDGAGATGALGISRNLVRGYWWRTWTIITVTMLIFLAVYIGIMMLASLALPFGSILSTASGQAAPNTLGLLLVTAVFAVLSAVLTPMLYAMMLVTYRDLQLRKGGADLAARIAAVA